MPTILEYENWEEDGGRQGWTKTEGGSNTVDGGVTPHANWTAAGAGILEAVATSGNGVAYFVRLFDATSDIMYIKFRLMLTQNGITTSGDAVITMAVWTPDDDLIMAHLLFNTGGTLYHTWGFNDDAGGLNFTFDTTPTVGVDDTIEYYWNSNGSTDEYEAWLNGTSVVSGSLTSSAAGWIGEYWAFGSIGNPTLSSQTTLQIDRSVMGDTTRLEKVPEMHPIVGGGPVAGVRGVGYKGILGLRSPKGYKKDQESGLYLRKAA